MTTELTPSTTARLDAMEAREKAASAGPWSVLDERSADHYAGLYVTTPPMEENPIETIARFEEGRAASWHGSTADAEFVAHARQDMPYLLAIARQALQDHEWIDEGEWGPDLCTCGEDWPCDMRKLLDAPTDPGES